MQESNQARETGRSDESDAPTGAGRIEANQAESEALAGRVMAAAADLTQREAAFLTLVGEFDAARAARWWDGIGSTAQWLAWACSIAPGTAREHVRVARALRRLPVFAAAFGRGELSYSKVRELTRLTGPHDEEKLLPLARAATAAQLSRTVCAYRTHSGSREVREQRTRVSWSSRADGLVQITAILLPEDGAAVVNALRSAADEFREDAKNTCPGTLADESAGAGPSGGSDNDNATEDGVAGNGAAGNGAAEVGAAASGAGNGGDAAAGAVPVTIPFDDAETVADIERRSRVSGLVAVSNHWIDSQPEDRSGADHTTVVIEIDAAELAATLVTAPTTPAQGNPNTVIDIQGEPLADVPAGTPQPDVPAGTSQPPHTAGHPETPVTSTLDAARDETDVPVTTPAATDSVQSPPLGNVPAGTPQPASAGDETDVPVPSSVANNPVQAQVPRPGNVPAGTSQQTSAPAHQPRPLRGVPAGACQVRGHGGIESDTARRLACEAQVHVIIGGLGGEPLAVSRSKRFGTKAQRRALMARDKHCQFPGCARRRHLKIHHIDHWVDGGATDLTNLLLLCHHHHTAVHEGHHTIVRAGSGPIRWLFQRPDGSTIIPEVAGLNLEQALPLLCDSYGNVLPDGPARDAAELHRQEIIEQNHQHRATVRAQQGNLTAQYRDVESTDDPKARRCFPVGGGAGFSLGNCVEVFFDSQRPETEDDDGEPDETLRTAA